MIPRLVLASLAFSVAMADTSSFSTEGCYSLSSLKSYLTSQGDYTYQTNSYCEGICDAAGYSVAATLDGSTCYCGNSLPSDIEAASSDKCDSTCNGYGSEICGGDGYLTVNTNGEEDTSPAEASSSSTSTSSSSSTTTTTTSSSSTSTEQPSSSTTFSSQQASSSSSSSTAASSTSISPSSSSPSSTSSSSSTTSKSSSSTSQQAATSIITSIITASNSVVATTTRVVSVSTSSSTATSTSSSSSVSKSSSGLGKGAIAGIAVGTVVGVLFLFGLLVLFYLRSRRNNGGDDDEDGDDYSEKHHTPPPVHNDMHGPNDYGAGFGSAEDVFQSVPPIPYYVTENGRKRLSDGSLPDARHEKTLRVTNPDETMNDTTLHEADQSYSDDDDDSFEKFKANFR